MPPKSEANYILETNFAPVSGAESAGGGRISLILESLRSHIAAAKSVEALEGAILAAADRITETLKSGGKILLAP